MKKNLKPWHLLLVGVALEILGRIVGGGIGDIVSIAGDIFIVISIIAYIRSKIQQRKAGA